MSQKVAAVFSGGGAKIGFHNGAKDYLTQKMGYRFDVVAGVSAGALVAVMVAQGKGELLTEICAGLSNEDVYTGSWSFLTALRIALGKDSIYGNGPIRRLIEENVAPAAFKIPCLVGAVDLISGEYATFSASQGTRLGSHGLAFSHSIIARQSPRLLGSAFEQGIPDDMFLRALLASTAIPVVWAPVRFLAGRWVDGGVRNISPIADVLAYEPDEIVIVNCSSREPMPAAGPLTNAVQIGMRALGIACDEIFRNDVERFTVLNRLAQQAEAQGAVLRHEDGRPYRSVPYLLIEPQIDLGPTLEFSPKWNRKRYEHGWRRAEEVCADAVQ
ncbi:MAG: patatin-like phospholipase family protein [bacterium]|nr:patatin-like phospholipase family protein [bacterium]